MIWITSKIAISANDCQYTVGRPRERPVEGGGTVTVIDHPTYHTTLPSAVRSAISAALRDGVADETITTLREFLKVQRQFQTEIESMLKPLDS